MKQLSSAQKALGNCSNCLVMHSGEILPTLLKKPKNRAKTPVSAHPLFIEDEPFRSVLPMVTFLVGENYGLYLHLAQLREQQLGENRTDKITGLSLDMSLKDISDWDELAIALVGSWEDKRGELEKLRFLVNNNLPADILKKGGSWEDKGRELTQKRAKVLLAVLLLTTEPVSLEELADVLGYRNREKFKEGYVNPLRDHRLIEYT